MATFYGSLQGEKKPKTKLGQRKIESHTRSWDHGVRTTYWLDAKDNAWCAIYLTGGSNNPANLKLIKSFKLGKVSKLRPGLNGFAGGKGD
jgi:hypothetical protein